MHCTSAAEKVAFVADLFTILAVIVAVVAAASALAVWRKQAEHNSALAALAAAKRYVDAIRAYRSPIRWAAEIGAAGLGGTAESERQILSWRSEKYVGPAKHDLYRAQVDASLLWGDGFDTAFKPLKDCMFDLEHYSDEYLRRLGGAPRLQSSKNLLEQAKSIVISSGSETKPDDFATKVNAAYSQLEALLRPKLAVVYRKTAKQGGSGAATKNSPRPGS